MLVCDVHHNDRDIDLMSCTCFLAMTMHKYMKCVFRSYQASSVHTCNLLMFLTTVAWDCIQLLLFLLYCRYCCCGVAQAWSLWRFRFRQPSFVQPCSFVLVPVLPFLFVFEPLLLPFDWQSLVVWLECESILGHAVAYLLLFVLSTTNEVSY